MLTLLGSTTDGRALAYDASLYEFRLDGESAEFADVRMLDARNWIRWRAPALRDWFRHIVPADLAACNKRAHANGRPQQTAAVAPDGGDYLVYRTTDSAVASVDDRGVVRVVGTGVADLYAHRVRNGLHGPEMRLATIVAQEDANVEHGEQRAKGKPGNNPDAATSPNVATAPNDAASPDAGENSWKSADVATAPNAKGKPGNNPDAAASSDTPSSSNFPSSPAADPKPEKNPGITTSSNLPSTPVAKGKKRKRKAPGSGHAPQQVAGEGERPSQPGESPASQRMQPVFGNAHPGTEFIKGVGGFATWNVR